MKINQINDNLLNGQKIMLKFLKIRQTQTLNDFTHSYLKEKLI